MGFKSKGWIQADNRFKKLKKELPKAAGFAVLRGVENLEKKSQIQVPKETGALSATGTIVSHSSRGYRRSKGYRYGTPGARDGGEGVVDYAAAVHEILKASHKSPTKAKFVEDPLVQGIPFDKRALKEECKAAVKRAMK